ncbi:MAG TPA: RidA family protein [Candidatus Nitrosotalea sp.]|nr:RidA family protein [Candidatus Nitrosotalea sp.]
MAKDVRAVHHPDKRRVEMPYAPALLVRRGSLLFLSGLTAAPVYHSHPHREEEFDLPTSMREQAVLLMENLKTTLAAAGCTLSDVVSATRYLTDVAEQDDLNAVWGAYLGAHRPTTTTVEVSRLATHANCKIEISVVAVADGEATARVRSGRARRSQRRAEQIPKKPKGSRRKTGRRSTSRRKR